MVTLEQKVDNQTNLARFLSSLSVHINTAMVGQTWPIAVRHFDYLYHPQGRKACSYGVDVSIFLDIDADCIELIVMR